MILGRLAIDWDFIADEIREEEGILGNGFMMANQLMVQPHEGILYLPETPTSSTIELGDWLSCIIHSICHRGDPGG